MSKDATQTSSTAPDANTSAWIDSWRKNITGAMGQVGNNANIYSGVRSNMQNDFNQQRQMATLQGNDLATKAGAFGGSRSAVLNGQLQNSVNQNETAGLSGLDLQQNQDQFSRLMQLLQLSGNAANVGGQTQTQQMPSNGLGSLLGLGATLLGGPLSGMFSGGGKGSDLAYQKKF